MLCLSFLLVAMLKCLVMTPLIKKESQGSDVQPITKANFRGFGLSWRSFSQLLAFFIFLSFDFWGKNARDENGGCRGKGKLFSLGLRTGDVLKKINDQKIYNISDIALQKVGEFFQ